jgi:hypothetical protein
MIDLFDRALALILAARVPATIVGPGAGGLPMPPGRE